MTYWWLSFADGKRPKGVSDFRPWDAVDELWDYRDNVAEGVPGAQERLRALRSGNGWNVPLKGKIVRIEDGEDKNADAAKEML